MNVPSAKARAFAKLFYQLLSADNWGMIDPTLFDGIARGEFNESDDEIEDGEYDEYAESLSGMITVVEGMLKAVSVETPDLFPDESLDAQQRNVMHVTIGTPTATLREIITRSLEAALSQTNGNQAKAAKLLGISPRAMCYRVKAHGLRDK